jgi:iron complex transport system permease protein
VGIAVIFALRWRLNILSLNDDEASSLGTNLQLMRLVFILASSMITASCVSMCGQVGWVGLLIPHIARMLCGNNNCRVIPFSISLGAFFMIIMDTFARSATAAEIPISILTALIGAPVFIILLRKTGGSWT